MAGDQLDQIWSDVQGSLARLVPENVYRIWLEHLKPAAVEDSTLYLEGPDQMVEWVRRRFGTTLTTAARAVDPLLQRVELLGHAAGQSRESRPEPEHTQPQPATGVPPRRLNPANSFAEFVIADGNRFAHAAALAVAELPAHTYNPLVVHGPPGTGKTHLLQAIANYVSAHDPQLSVQYLTAEAFATSFRSALRTDSMDAFKQRHRSANVLLIDDVHFLGDKKHTLDELLHTIEDQIESGSQVVLSAELSPAELPSLGTRLQDRLQGGLVAEVADPDTEARLAILRKRAPELGQEPGHIDLLRHLAERVPGNVRALEGALIRVHAYASLTHRPLTIELAEHVVSNLDQSGPARPTRPRRTPAIHDIQARISTVFGLPQTDLSSQKRSRQVVYARQVAMYLCRELTPLSLPAISSQFGGRDHTTVLHAHRKIKQRLLTDAETRSLVEELSRELSSTEDTD